MPLPPATPVDTQTGTSSRRAFIAGGASMLGMITLASCKKAANSTRRTTNQDLVVGQVGDILATAPVTATANNASWRGAVFESLGRVHQDTGKIDPLLATAWTQSPDGKTITFTTRSGVRWHSGRAFTAKDVIYTLTTLRDGSVLSRPFNEAWFLKTIETMSVRGNDVVITLKSPVAGSLPVLAAIAILDRETIQGFNNGTRFVGTGPFIFADRKVDATVSLKRFDNYWAKAEPSLRSINVQIFSRDDALLAALRTGQVQMTNSLSPRDLATLARDKTFSRTRTPSNQGIYLGMNVAVPPFNDHRVRQAIAYAVDRQRIAADVFKGQAIPSAAPWAPGAPAYDPSTRDFYPHDTARAAQLLKQAGAHGMKVIYEVSGAKPVLAQVAQIVAFDLGQAGLDVSLRVLTPADNDRKFQTANFAGLYTAGDGQNSSAPPFLFLGNPPWSAKKNLWGFTSPTFSTLTTRATNAVGATAIRRMGTELTKYVLDQAFCTELVITDGVLVSDHVGGITFASGQLVYNDARM